jgi:hypothetical protein
LAIGVVGDADALGPGVFGFGLGAANALQTKFGKECVLSQELEQTKKKKAVLVSVKLVKRKLLKL